MCSEVALGSDAVTGGRGARLPGVAPRPGLTEQLDLIQESAVILLAAPAGYGKSACVAAWAERQEAPVSTTWVRCGPAEAPADLTTIAGELTERMPAGGLGVVVVEDAGRSWPSPVVDHAAGFAAAMPPSTALIVCSRDARTKPWIPIHAEGRLTVIGPADLAFDDDEVGRALQEWSGLPVPDRVRDQVNARTQGWAMGLRVAADELRRHRGERFSESWLVGSPELEAYFRDDVLSTMPDADVEFAESTAELPSLDPRLCDHLVGRGDSAERLDGFVQAGWFTQRDHDQRGVFVYHPLFAGELSRRARGRDPQQVRHVLQLASDWHRDHDDPDHAVEAGLRAGDGARVAALLRAVSGAKLRGGQAAQLMGWMERMPQADLWRDPALALALARACGLSGDSMTPRAVLRATDADPAMSDPPLGLRVVRAQLESSMYGWEGRLASMGEPLRGLPDRLDELVNDPYLTICAIDETAMANCRVRALLLTGQLGPALAASEAVLTPMELHNPSRYTIAAVGLRALALAWAERLPEAKEAVRQGQKVLARFRGAGEDAVWLHVATCWVGDPEEARDSLARVEQFAAGSGLPYRRVLAALAGLALHSRLGHSAEVAAAFAVADREVHALPEPGYLEVLLERFRADAEVPGESQELNPQEVVMLRLLARGATRSRIAHETSYSVNTVKAYLRSAYRKLGAADRDEAVAAAVAMNIVDGASVVHPGRSQG